jgi:hypothetical protein
MIFDEYECKDTFALGDKIRSRRLYNLVLSTKYEWVTPVLTVELYTKWYELFLIAKMQGSLHLYAVHYGHLEDYCPEGQSAFRDHVPNPLAVRNFADAKDYHLDELADDLLMGRWQNEAVDFSYCPDCEGEGGQLVVPDSLTLKARWRCCPRCRGTRSIPRGE